MSDYIKRDDAIKELLGCVPTDAHEIKDLDVIRLMLALPAADVASIRCGRWEDEFKEDAEAFMKYRHVCTVCGNWQTYGKTAYCPNCGASMDR